MAVHNSRMDARERARAFELTRAPADFIDDPYPWYAALREHDPVHALEGGGVFLSRYEDALAAYRDPRMSSDKKAEFRPKLGDSPLYEHHTTSLVFNDPPLHTRVRRIIMGALNQRAIARMEADVAKLVERLLDEMAEAREVNFIDAFAAQIPIEVIGNLLDVPREARAPLRGWSVAILSGLEPTLTPAMHEAGNRAVTEFVALLKELIADRRKHPGDDEADVLTRLIQGEQDGERLTETELYHQCIFMLNAGHETTTNLIGNGTWLLLTHPAELARLRADPALVPTAVEEMLRLRGVAFHSAVPAAHLVERRGSMKCATPSGDTPTPVSATLRATSPPASLASMVIVPPSGMASRAFTARLSSTCSIVPASAWM